jgi:predicted nucleic acid-binding protein
MGKQVILVDTNVISELSKPAPNPRVVKWVDDNERGGLWLSAITVAELLTGLAELPEGKRKTDLTELVNELMARYQATRVYFDDDAAEKYAAIVTARKRIGRPMEVFDAQIASIAVSNGLTLATMNTKDFEGIEGLTVVDPSD